MSYKNVTLSAGWITFGLSFLVYFITVEPSVSFWDCGEFIASAYKLEIAHPPGAPLFTLAGRLFALFAGADTSQVAFFVNLLSAISSAWTVAFLCWTIIMLGQKISESRHLILLSGITGSLAFAFTDSFWFSAVEAEVYAMSSLFTAVTFWAMLKWEKKADEAGSTRWLVLIVYLLGLSVGVHLLNLLAIPAIVLIYVFKRYPFSTKRLFSSLFFSVLLAGFIFKVLLPGIPYLGALLDLMFVNTFSLPFNSGFLFFLIVSLSLLAWLSFRKYAVRYSYLKLVFSFFFVFVLGFSSYTTIIIRSLANPSIDMNNPDNPFSLISYLNREQYASRPLVFGNYYNAPVLSHDKRKTYIPFQNQYIPEPLNPKVNYDKRFSTFFPRMASTDASHAKAYKKWADIKSRKMNAEQGKTTAVPTFGENLRFFFRYQVGHMYVRYFLWNFSGRQNDVQGFGSTLNGNWITGIRPIDKIFLGTDKVATEAPEANKTRNTYFMLPLLLGIAGIVFHYQRRKSDFWVLLSLFVMTGLAIVIYLNEIPITPRERDYVYVGSFYVFAIWIGLGIFAVHRFLTRYIASAPAYAITLVTAIAGVPLLLFLQNVDDHNRSHRFIARDFAKNYLQSCQQDAILFTTADNDTYPVWYVQEVEGIRTDVANVLLPYLSANWYINQKRRKTSEASPLPVLLPPEKFVDNQRSFIPVLDKIKEPVNLKDLLIFIGSDNRNTKIRTRDFNYVDYLPARKFFINASLPDGSKTTLYGEFEGNYLLKSDLIVLDILAHNEFQRPVYFLNPQQPKKLGLTDYLKREGFAYRLTTDNSGEYLTERNFELLMNVFSWGNLANEDVYVDWTTRRTIGLVLRARNDFAKLAQILVNEGNKGKALQVVNKCLEILPHHKLAPDLSTLSLASVYYSCGQSHLANQLLDDFNHHASANLAYLESFKQKDKEIHFERQKYQYYLQQSHAMKIGLQ